MIRGEKYFKPIQSGFSRPHLILCTDGQFYILKLRSNPQGNMVLVNEIISYRLALLLDLPVPKGEVILLEEHFISQTPQLQTANAQAGLHFGSLFIPDSVNLTHGTDLSRVDNIVKAADIILFDYWVNNNDRHLFNGASTNLLVTNSGTPHLWMIDQANILNGPHWDEHSIIAHQPYISTYWGEVYQKFVPYLDQEFPFKNSLPNYENLNSSVLTEVVSDLPQEWGFPAQSGHALVNYLLSRLTLLPRAIEAVHIHFPVWNYYFRQTEV
ncbi:HipA family kinase [Paenibacillus sp. FSL K6-1096]|uniref:HipA family kinase n=1 Tax=Paenibacillus sp. FSL K6-1096 TaxID=2921460 RepID=UPI0030ED6C58